MTKSDEWKTMLFGISDEIQDLWLDRQVWRGLISIATQNAIAHDSFFVGWVGEHYYRRAALSIRAMVDSDPHSISLINLLEDIERNPADLPHPTIDMYAPTASIVDPKLVQKDIDDLKAVAKRVKNYVNKYLAHIDRAPKVEVPASAEVDDAVQLLGEMLKKYTLMITNIDLRVETVWGFDWTAVFREPWLR